MDATRKEVIAWCKENNISFMASDSMPPAPEGWMFAHQGGDGGMVVLTAVFTNTDDDDVTISDVIG